MTKAERYRSARKALLPPDVSVDPRKQEAEGGCGVVGLLASIPVAGKHLYVPSVQMQNRGNGKGGGIAAVGLVPAELGVSERVLSEDYILQLAYLDPSARRDVESQFVLTRFLVDEIREVETLDDPRDAGLEVKPPDVVRYFVRPEPDALDRFTEQKELLELRRDEAEDEFVYQNTYEINRRFYASLGDKRAFVLSHAKNLLVLKLVGYAEQVIDYYKLHDFHSHGWIAHQRYPTKGRVWHPGGAHPFVGMHEALVHNGDFANYYGVCEYLKQHGLHPLFLTDTEVSVLLFDLLCRGFDYPLEWAIEAMAPTTERDFLKLPPERRHIYKRLQVSHLNGSPDGPWFFIIARNDVRSRQFQLLGITDTSMLRPQVFAMHDGEAQVGVIASEKQAIDATLQSLAREDSRICPVADSYWNARGGSHTDGGAFLFSLDYGNGEGRLEITNKFDEPVALPAGSALPRPSRPIELPGDLQELTRLRDLPPAFDHVPRKWLMAAAGEAINRWLDDAPWTRLASPDQPIPPGTDDQPLIIDATSFAAQGPGSVAAAIVRAYREGWREITVYGCKGHRFIGCGLQEQSTGLRLHVYGSSGDYLASGLDGAEVFVHGNAQDQLGQIFHRGTLVVYGDVGQTFFYGAKGGEAFILGNAAGRPLINAVGQPRVVINGTCLDYLGESFMAGDPLNGGGFVIVNGICRDEHGQAQDLPEPYPGGNLFSLASGGAVYIRDPQQKVDHDQLNGGEFAELAPEDWTLIETYLRKNESLFGIRVEEELLRGQPPSAVYRKIRPIRTAALH